MHSRKKLTLLGIVISSYVLLFYGVRLISIIFGYNKAIISIISLIFFWPSALLNALIFFMSGIILLGNIPIIIFHIFNIFMFYWLIRFFFFLKGLRRENSKAS